MSTRYQQSEVLLDRALKSIPLASQTFSKSYMNFPKGAAPLFIERGQGSHVWDVDGNEYIDFVSGLASITLGYNDPDVNLAVTAQMKNGVTFSLPHRLEMEVAEQIIDMVPCAEMVRYGKNGSDATTGAIRLARAYTSREHVAVCGYHGWQDWYIGSTTRDLGVPESTKQLTHKFVYNDLESLSGLFDQYPNQISAVVLEPMNTEFPKDNFLEKVKALTHKNGAILIFDEMITGLRFAKGGAQEYFNVTPDLATLGKGLANGYPLSAVVGRRDLLQLMDEIFFSFTFGGETLSLAAANATLKKVREAPVVEHLAELGRRILDGFYKIISEYKMESVIRLCGHPAWTLLRFNQVESYDAWEIKTYWMQEVLKRGILMSASHNLTYSHTDADIDRLLSVYREVIPLLGSMISKKQLTQSLTCDVIEPLFEVR